MLEHTPSRLGAGAGIVFVLGALMLNSVEDPGNAVLAAEVLVLTVLVPFLAHLHALLRAAGAGWAATTVLAAGLTALAVKLAGVLPAIVAEQGGIDTAVADAFIRIGEVSFIAMAFPLAVMLAAVAVSALRTGALPAPVGWGAAAVAPLLAVNGFDLGAEFAPAFLLFLVWTLGTSIVLVARAVREDAGNPAPAAA